MSEPWLNVVGIGEDGLDGLNAMATEALERAEVIVGGDRHHDLSARITAERLSWPSPFDAMIETIRSLKGRHPVVLVTGDPLWYSVGARLLRAIASDEITFHPQLSAFQWAAVRMGWSLADCATLTVHGRPLAQIVPALAPNRRLLVLTKDATTPRAVAALLVAKGYDASRMTALAALGGEREERFDGTASEWRHDVPDFHTLAIDCVASVPAEPLLGLPDDAYEHDGQLTKRAVRAATLAKLAPYPGGLLWDVGAGCGSIGIEWTRSAAEARAIAIEPKSERRFMTARNADALGAPSLRLVEGRAPDALEGLPTPDAIFIGGGLTTPGAFERCWDALRHDGRLVANAVTLESEARLFDLHAEHGGELTRIAVSRAEAIGPYRGWRPSMPVTQWSVVR